MSHWFWWSRYFFLQIYIYSLMIEDQSCEKVKVCKDLKSVCTRVMGCPQGLCHGLGESTKGIFSGFLTARKLEK